MEIKSVVFISNFLSPHQKPFCDELYNKFNDKFKFVATRPINNERIKLGYEDLNNTKYVIKAYEEKNNIDKIKSVINNSDVAIIGSAPDKYITERLKLKKITFKYSERILKEELNLKRMFRFILGTWLHHGRFMKYPIYMLCASAFEAYDLSLLKYYKKRTFKWGYFPKTVLYDNIDELIDRKEENSILWVGRFIDWKHPEYCIELAKKLIEQNKQFKITMIGEGELKKSIKDKITEEKLEDYIVVLNSMKTQEVRKWMEKSSILIATSNRKEGWGAVVNEAMNSACIVVASSMMGAVPFLIKNNKNGIIFENENVNDLFKKVNNVLSNSKKFKIIGKNAYDTIINEWNEKVALRNLLVLSEELKNRKNLENNEIQNGPCSNAQIINDNWFDNIERNGEDV